MAKIRYLHAPPGRDDLYFRRKVPAELRALFGCGEFYKVPLGTKDMRAAEPLLAIAKGEYEKKAALFRETLKDGAAGALSPEDASALVGRHLLARAAGTPHRRRPARDQPDRRVATRLRLPHTPNDHGPEVPARSVDPPTSRMRHTMIDEIIEPHVKPLGAGMEVNRALPAAARRMIGPFVFFDQLGPLEMQPGIGREVNVRPHPHIGMSAVTYMFFGEVMHRDSLGFEQAIRPMEVNWMTAGSGITHSERFEKARLDGDRLHLIQAWVAMPTELEESAPSFANHSGSDLPSWREGGVEGRLIAGEAYGLKAAAETLSLFYVHLFIETGATTDVPRKYAERGVYVASGSIEIDGVAHGARRMLVLGRGTSRVKALEPSIVMLLGGEPIGNRYLY